MAQSIKDRGLLTRPLMMSARSFGAVDDARWDDLTLRHALTHATGFPNWRSTGELLAFEADPGTPGYSGEGYELLLAELSAQLQTPAAILLEDHLQGLGMVASSFTPPLDGRVDLAIGHTELGESVPKAAVEAARASGSLHTTIADYMRFLVAIARPETHAGPATRAGASRLADRDIETIAGHGRTLGWTFTHTPAGDVLWQHGDNSGFKHVAAARPDTGDAVVVFTNTDSGQAFYREICKRFLQVEVR